MFRLSTLLTHQVFDSWRQRGGAAPAPGRTTETAGPRPLKVLFIIQGTDTPSSRVRVVDMIPELERHGLRSDTRIFPGTARERLELSWHCRDYDVVCIQKKLPSRLFLSLLRRFSRRLVFDFDDAIYCRHSSSQRRGGRSRGARFRNLLRQCDLIIAGNRILAEKARSVTGNPVAIIPSAVETRDIPVKGEWNAKPVLGWVGGANNLPFLKLWQRPLSRLAERHPFVLRILSSEPIELEGVETEFVPWSLEGQAREIAHFDVGLMPLPDDEHARGKCAYKAIQYLAAGIPAVVSDVGINGEVVRDGEHGHVVRNPAEVENALAVLLADPAGSLAMGRRGRSWVDGRFSIELNAPNLVSLLVSVSECGMSQTR
jgi:glycosyltransferase involved in cell wall biosynthesis